MLYFRYMALRRNSKFFFHQVPKESLEPLASTSPCHLIKAWLKRINVDPTGYGSHSLRRGGATAAAAALVRFHVLKRHGRWKSDTVYLYIVDGPEEQLGVSQAVLGPSRKSLRACAFVAGFVTESLRISMHGLLTKHLACCANNSS